MRIVFKENRSDGLNGHFFLAVDMANLRIHGRGTKR